MEAEKKMDVIVKFLLDDPSEKVMKYAQLFVSEIVKERDWEKPQETKITLGLGDKAGITPNQNVVEFRMVITPDMTKDDLTELALNFVHWLKGSD